MTVDDGPINVLVSYHYYRTQPDVTARLRAADPRVRVLCDSGAFTAWTQGTVIDPDEYAGWAHQQLVDGAVGVFTLDVIGNPDASWQSWRYLRVNHQLGTIPIVHLGTELNEFDRYAEHTDFVGCGGMVGKPRNRVMRWAVAGLRHCRDRLPYVRLHGLGVSGRDTAERLPWYSIDTSGFGSAYRYGSVRLFDPTRGQFVSVRLNGVDLHRYGRLIRDVYGCDPRIVARSHSGSLDRVVGMAGATAWLWQNWVRRRAAPVPPPSDVRDGAPGLHVHLVDGSFSNLMRLIEGIAAVLPPQHNDERQPA